MRLLLKVASIVFGLGVFGAFATPVRAETLGDSAKPIRLSVQEWTAQIVSVHIVGQLLEKIGYKVEYVTIGTVPGFQALIDKDIDVTIENWLQTDYKLLHDALKDGRVEDLGDVGIAAIQSWYYPAYVEKDCPSLPDWKALKDCAALFSTPETLGRGRFLDYPADWPSNNEARVKALGLDYQIVKAGSEGALVAEIKSAFDRKQPLLVQFWEPHWIFTQYDLKRVKLPPYQEGCFEDPKVGINPNATFDCDWNTVRVLKTARSGVAKTWPAAYKFLKAYSFTNADQAEMMLSVDVQGNSAEKAAAAWIEKNKARCEDWIKSATN